MRLQIKMGTGLGRFLDTKLFLTLATGYEKKMKIFTWRNSKYGTLSLVSPLTIFISYLLKYNAKKKFKGFRMKFIPFKKSNTKIGLPDCRLLLQSQNNFSLHGKFSSTL